MALEVDGRTWFYSIRNMLFQGETGVFQGETSLFHGETSVFQGETAVSM